MIRLARSSRCLLLALLPGFCVAQIGPLEAEVRTNTTFAVRPLEELLDDAVQFSPLLKGRDLMVENVLLELQILKKEWTQYFNVIGSYQLGNIRYLDNVDFENGEQVRTITRENSFYGIGLQARLPLNSIVTRRQQRSILENKLEQEKLQRFQDELTLRELVIRQYHELQLAVEKMAISARDLDFRTLTAERAETYFREGNLELKEYTDAVGERNRAELTLAETRIEALVAIQVLRELVGRDVTAR